MRISRSLSSLAAAGLALALAAPVAAHTDHDAPPPDAVLDAEGRDYADLPPMPHPEMDGMRHMPAPMDHREHWGRMRGEWLAQCRARTGWRVSHRDDWDDDGVGGALIGGLAGGMLGNRVAGKGDRVVGTVVGAAAGAAVGAAVDKAEDRGRHAYDDGRRGDYCEQYFDYYTQAGHRGGWGYAQPMMMVPVLMMPGHGHGHGKVCKETVVTEEWVTVRHPRRHRVIRDKRVRIAPDKRLPMK